MSKTTRVLRLPRFTPITLPALLGVLQSVKTLAQHRLPTLAATGLGLIVAGAGYILFAPLPLASESDPSRVTAQNGEVIGDLVSAGVTRREASLDEIPQYLQEATIAVEDASFYQHRGLNVKGIIRALLA
ncbi:MAG: transglycosylase domain-containing protein, partial [Bacilli bacterium]